MEALVHVTRGDIIEAVHYGDIAVCDVTGKLLGSVGDPSRRIYWRSSAKPIQALPVVYSGAADRFGFTAKELSVCCASHCGSAEHVDTVRGILAKIGLDEAALQCGTHVPGDPQQRQWLAANNRDPLPVMNNCSGKHAGKLASTVAMGGDVERYLELDSPVQQAILRDMSVLSGVAEQDMVISTDGCSAPTHGFGLREMATSFARLCWPDDMPTRIQSSAPRIIAAMAAEPVMVSGRGSFNSELLAAFQGRVVAKGGAEGLMVLGLTARGIGIAVRSRDGSARGQSVVVLEILDQLGALDDEARQALDRFIKPQLRNCRDDVIGHICAAGFRLGA